MCIMPYKISSFQWNEGDSNDKTCKEIEKCDPYWRINADSRNWFCKDMDIGLSSQRPQRSYYNTLKELKQIIRITTQQIVNFNREKKKLQRKPNGNSRVKKNKNKSEKFISHHSCIG